MNVYNCICFHIILHNLKFEMLLTVNYTPKLYYTNINQSLDVKKYCMKMKTKTKSFPKCAFIYFQMQQVNIVQFVRAQCKFDLCFVSDLVVHTNAIAMDDNCNVTYWIHNL